MRLKVLIQLSIDTILVTVLFVGMIVPVESFQGVIGTTLKFLTELKSGIVDVPQRVKSCFPTNFIKSLKVKSLILKPYKIKSLIHNRKSLIALLKDYISQKSSSTTAVCWFVWLC